MVEKYRSVTNMAGTILIAWILSALVAQIISLSLSQSSISLAMPLPKSDMEEDRSFFTNSALKTVDAYMKICDRDIFDSQHRSTCSAGEMSTADEGAVLDLDSPAIKSDLSATLLGTMVSSIPSRSFGTIAGKDGKDAQNYHVDDTLMEEAKIYEIQRNRVFFIRNGHREYIEVDRLPMFQDDRFSGTTPPPSEGIKRIGDKVMVTRSKVDATLGNLNNIVQDSRMVPNFEGGVVNGFKIFAIRPGSIFEELGLKNGDIVQRINGTEIDSVEKALPMMQLLKTEPSIAIDIVRGGAKKSLSIEIR